MDATEPAPKNPWLFWTCYLVGTLGPFAGTLLIGYLSRPMFDEVGFIRGIALWFFGAILLAACAWSVRPILWKNRGLGRRVWLYRIFGWLALIEALIWAWTSIRVL